MSRANQRRIDPAERKQARMRSLQRIGRVLMFALLSGATFAGGYWLNQRWSVAHWQIQGDAPLRAAIEQQLQAMAQRDFLSTRPELLRRQWLQRIPDLADVRITRVLPDRLQISAEARVPTALWQDEQNRLHLVDANGVAYRLLRKGESPDLPLLRLPAAELAEAHRMLTALGRQNRAYLALLSEVRAGGGHWRIYFSRGVSWLIPQVGGDAVIERITALLKQPRWRSGHWRVDARLASRWFLRPAGHGGVI